MFLQVVTAVEQFPAHITTERLANFMLPHVTQTVILPNELATTVIARVWPNIAMGMHVRSVIVTTKECALAQGTFEGL
jgi:hypothetical protein